MARFFIDAAMLVAQYRTRRPGVNEPKIEAVDAETNKLILTALAEFTGQEPPIPLMEKTIRRALSPIVVREDE